MALFKCSLQILGFNYYYIKKINIHFYHIQYIGNFTKGNKTFTGEPAKLKFLQG
jgi:hypothetical protein